MDLASILKFTNVAFDQLPPNGHNCQPFGLAGITVLGGLIMAPHAL